MHYNAEDTATLYYIEAHRKTGQYIKDIQKASIY